MIPKHIVQQIKYVRERRDALVRHVQYLRAENEELKRARDFSAEAAAGAVSMLKKKIDSLHIENQRLQEALRILEGWTHEEVERLKTRFHSLPASRDFEQYQRARLDATRSFLPVIRQAIDEASGGQNGGQESPPQADSAVHADDTNPLD